VSPRLSSISKTPQPSSRPGAAFLASTKTTMTASSKFPALRRRLLPYPLLLAMLLGLTGCLTFETLITVKPDGSGTVEQTFIVMNEMLRMALLFGGEDGEPAELCDEAQLHEEAAAMGEGVRLIDAEAINDGDALGCRARFAFDDINTLHVSFNPEDQMPDGMAEDEAATEEPGDEAAMKDFLTFRFDPGRPSTLVVMLDQEDAAADTPDGDPIIPDSSQRAQQMMMMREMFKGARVAVFLEVDGSIRETDATFHEDDRITLMEIDFDRLLEDEAALEKLVAANPQSPDEMKTLMEGVEGVKVETREAVTVRF
jgi:hypothetical protein